MKKSIILSVAAGCLLLSSLPCQVAGQGHQIRVEIAGIGDTSLILAHRYGHRFYTDDTIRLDASGSGVFESEQPLAHGMYQLVFPDKSFTEFFVDEDQEFTIQTRYPDFIQHNRAIGHGGNQLFYDWYRASALLRDQPGMKVVWDTTLQAAGNSLVGQFLKALRPFTLPDHLKNDPDFMNNRQAQYQHYKAHYFDEVNLTNPALIRTPIIHNKLSSFFEQVVPPHPDSISAYCDLVLEKTRPSEEVFRYTLQWLLNYYSDPKLMGTDAVYVHLAENYYLTGVADWISEENLNLIRSRTEELKPMLIGKQAPAVDGLLTPEGEMVNIFEREHRYKILYFWEPDCGHCKTATPELFALYPGLREKGVEVFAIHTRLNDESWLTYIAEHELTWVNLWAPYHMRELIEAYQAWATPKLVVLDSQNRIVGKDLAVSQLKDFIDHLTGSR